ncbi:DUF3096 domain-containing protein [Candidatus Micrarchaeota archaeon]|nr:DUF3096 domain-containing protein [Candidatus Micrarchaeota archaeon]
MARRSLKISMTREAGAIVFILAGILVIVFPHLLTWILGLALILKGLSELF